VTTKEICLNRTEAFHSNASEILGKMPLLHSFSL
jgi:hypothetical protein